MGISLGHDVFCKLVLLSYHLDLAVVVKIAATRPCLATSSFLFMEIRQMAYGNCLLPEMITTILLCTLEVILGLAGDKGYTSFGTGILLPNLHWLIPKHRVFFRVSAIPNDKFNPKLSCFTPTVLLTFRRKRNICNSHTSQACYLGSDILRPTNNNYKFIKKSIPPDIKSIPSRTPQVPK